MLSLNTNWFACKITSGRKSALYGIRFSYPLFISLVTAGIFLENPYLLLATALIALFGVILPMHPFDYVYNYVLTKLIKTQPIPGRGSEMHVSSGVALLFNLFVIAALLFKFQLNYAVMSLVYVLISVFFVAIQLFTDNLSVNFISGLFLKKSR